MPARFVPDHKDPLARGGSLALDNLAPSCAPCNHRKGKMSAAGFEYLLACAAKLSEPDRTDLMQRLEIAVQLAAQRRWHGRKPKPGQPPTADGGALLSDKAKAQFFPGQRRKVELNDWDPLYDRQQGDKRIKLDLIMPITGQPLLALPDFVTPGYERMDVENSAIDEIDLRTEIEGITVEIYHTHESGPMEVEWGKGLDEAEAEAADRKRKLMLTACTLKGFKLVRVNREKQSLVALTFSINTKRDTLLVVWAHKYQGATFWAEFSATKQELPERAARAGDAAPGRAVQGDERLRDGQGPQRTARQSRRAGLPVPRVHPHPGPSRRAPEDARRQEQPSAPEAEDADRGEGELTDVRAQDIFDIVLERVRECQRLERPHHRHPPRRERQRGTAGRGAPAAGVRRRLRHRRPPRSAPVAQPRPGLRALLRPGTPNTAPRSRS
jgi:hypothetical protein